jgi:hypothetical protein
VSRLVLLLISVAAGVVMAVAVTYMVTEVLAGSNATPVNQQLYNYGTR